MYVGVPGRSAKSATGLAEAGRVWQKPAAAVDANAAATGLTPHGHRGGDHQRDQDGGAGGAGLERQVGRRTDHDHSGEEQPRRRGRATGHPAHQPVGRARFGERDAHRHGGGHEQEQWPGHRPQPVLETHRAQGGRRGDDGADEGDHRGRHPCSGSLHHSRTTVPSSSRHRASGGVSGPDTGASECSWICAVVIRTGPVRSARRVVVNSTSSAARWEETTASGSPRISQVTKLSCSPVCSHRTPTVIR